MEYRVLSREEINGFVHIDRTESIDYIHYMRDGNLISEFEHWDVPDWSAAEKEQRIASLQEKYDKGATFFGAFDGFILTGISVLGHNPVSSGVNRLNLAGLWVSHNYRGKGIGKILFGLAAQEARKRGVKSLYVSATPSENTIRFYKSMGCQLAEPVDPQMFEKEPEDIHLELVLQNQDGKL